MHLILDLHFMFKCHENKHKHVCVQLLECGIACRESYYVATCESANKDLILQDFEVKQSLDLTCGVSTFATVGRRTAPQTIAEQEGQRRLEQALDNLRDAIPPCLFARRWQLLRARAHGGQAVVQVRRCMLLQRLFDACYPYSNTK